MARTLARTGAQATDPDNSPDTRPSKRRRTDSNPNGVRNHLSSPAKSTIDAQQETREPRRRSEPQKSRAANTPASTRRGTTVADGAQISARRVSRRLQEVAAEHDAEAGPQQAAEEDDDSDALKPSEENLIDSAYGSKEDSLVESGPTQDDAESAPLSSKEPTSLQPADSSASLEIPETPGNEREVAQTAKSKKSSTRRIYSQQRKSSITKRPSARKAELETETETDRSRSIMEPRPASTNAETTGDAVIISESEDELQSAGTTPMKTPSARSRRAPARYSVESEPSREPTPVRASAVKNASAALVSPQPKGILTPSKGRRNARPKSVVFDPDEQQIRAQLGFRDIDESAEKSSRSTRTKGTTSYAEAEDDIALEDDLPEPTREDDPLLDFDQPLDLLQSLQQTRALPAIQNIDDSPSVSSIKQHVLSQLTSATPCPPGPRLSTQQATLTNLLRSTIVSGESNSLLMLGPRGSGKTLLLEHVLKELEEEHSSLFHVVRLNGFFQTDDRVALREIWRQLGRETQDSSADGDDPVAGTAGLSYADTLASLLSLLSHADEMEPDLDGVDVRMTDDADGLSSKVAKSTIIILDEFDLFTLHPRQTMLYNLFDIAQSRKAPIAVVGCSTRMDVVESLEKRVKSRFSHRWLHIPPVRTLGEMNEVVERALTISEPEHDQADAIHWNDHIKVCNAPSRYLGQTNMPRSAIAPALASHRTANLTDLLHYQIHLRRSRSAIHPNRNPASSTDNHIFYKSTKITTLRRNNRSLNQHPTPPHFLHQFSPHDSLPRPLPPYTPPRPPRRSLLALIPLPSPLLLHHLHALPVPAEPH
jgi:hypothetical protein